MATLEFLQNNIHVLGIVMMFCVVQSVFGMGLLIFGTPTLIILDVPFLECLIYLIPASLTISLLQVIPERTFWHPNIGRSVPLLAFAVTAGFLIHKLPFGTIRLDGLLGAVMLCYGLTRIFTRIGAVASQFVRHRYNVMLVAMGVLHGVSNMGGAILAILSSARFSDKNDLRAFVAMNYAVLAGSQFVILLFVMEHKHILSFLISSTVALSVYTLIGKHVFWSMGAKLFHNLFTVFIFAYSAALFWKYLLYA
jgi:hypothetical protein